MTTDILRHALGDLPRGLVEYTAYLHDGLAELIVLHQLVKVEIGVVGQQEEDARRQKFVVGVIALCRLSYAQQLQLRLRRTTNLELLSSIFRETLVDKDLAGGGLQEQGVGNAAQGFARSLGRRV